MKDSYYIAYCYPDSKGAVHYDCEVIEKEPLVWLSERRRSGRCKPTVLVYWKKLDKEELKGSVDFMS
jgi:hypothetical protein